MSEQHVASIPPDVTEQAIIRNLGPLRLSIRGAWSGLLFFAVIGLWLFVLLFDAFALFILVIGILNVQFAALLVALLCGAATTPFLYLALRSSSELRTNSRSSYYIFRDGFILRQGNANEVFSWADITTLWQEGYTFAEMPTGYRYRLQCADGRRLTLFWRSVAVGREKFATLRQFAELLVHEVTNRHIREALRALDAREALTFGAFTLNMGGLTYKEATLPWNQVHRVQTASGVFSIYQTGKRFFWAHQKIARIPNFTVFLELVERMSRST